MAFRVTSRNMINLITKLDLIFIYSFWIETKFSCALYEVKEVSGISLVITIGTRELNYHLHARPIDLRKKHYQYPLQRNVIETQRLSGRCGRETLLRHKEIRPGWFICPVRNLSLYLLLDCGVSITCNSVMSVTEVYNFKSLLVIAFLKKLCAKRT
jgi:hypothetical protein